MLRVCVTEEVSVEDAVAVWLRVCVPETELVDDGVPVGDEVVVLLGETL